MKRAWICKKKKENILEKMIDKNISFRELLEKHPESEEILMKSGMHCIGCPMAMQETLEEGAMAHGIDAEELVGKINERLKNNGK